MIIEGVPPIGWAVGKYSYHVAALHAALSVMGCQMSYEELVTVSGAGFQIAYAPGRASHVFAGVWPPAMDHVLSAAEAAGAEARWVTFDQNSDAAKAIFESIDAGAPVVAWEQLGAKVIFGYEGVSIHVQSCNSPDGTAQVGPFAVDGTRRSGGAPEVVLLTYEPAQELPEIDWPAALSRAIWLADRAPDEMMHDRYVLGFSAYDAWAEHLRDLGATHDANVLDAQLIEAHAATVGEARACVSKALLLHESVHAAFAEAASFYAAEADIFRRIPKVMSGGRPDLPFSERIQLMAERLGTEAVASELAEMVEAAKWEDAQAVEALREALTDLGPPDVPIEAPERVEAEDAQALHQRGLQLKRGRRYAEAATVLREAIAADPDFVDAHWALAWTLVELGDTTGAKAEFERVMELAPGSPKAADAQNAVDRLGQ